MDLSFKKKYLKCHFIAFSFFMISSFSTAQSTNYFDNYLEKGHAFYDSRKMDSCQFYLKKLDSLIALAPIDSSKFFRLEVLKSNISLFENKKGEAIETLLVALTYFKKQKDSASIGLCLYRLGVANYYVNRRGVSGDYFEEALQYSKFISKRLKTRIYQNFGSINLEVGMGMSRTKKDNSLIYKAIKSYEEAIKIYQEEGWIMEEALATSLLAECYNQLKDYDTALSIINKAIELSQKANNKSQEGFALIKKTSILGNKSKYKEALKTIQIAKLIFKELKDYTTYLYALNEEKKILIGLKRYKEATQVGDSIYATSVESYNTRFTDKVSEMDAKYKTAEKEKELALQKQELLDQKLELQNRNLYIIGISSALIIILIISIGLYKRQQFKRSQLQKEFELKNSLSKIKTQNKLQEQRLEISRDLHDNIGSQLTFIISSIDNLKYVSKDMSDKLKDKLASISSFTFDTIHQLRDTIWVMNKNEITFDEFLSRVLSYIEKVKTVKPDLHFGTSTNISDTIIFSSLQGMNLFRVIQESINNSLKHADANEIHLSFHQEKEHLSFVIIDNGKGFDKENIEAGNGLSNIENRISSINGEVFINSAKKLGTTISIKIPI